jgi:hypothetical protein
MWAFTGIVAALSRIKVVVNISWVPLQIGPVSNMMISPFVRVWVMIIIILARKCGTFQTASKKIHFSVQRGENQQKVLDVRNPLVTLGGLLVCV